MIRIPAIPAGIQGIGVYIGIYIYIGVSVLVSYTGPSCTQKTAVMVIRIPAILYTDHASSSTGPEALVYEAKLLHKPDEGVSLFTGFGV